MKTKETSTCRKCGGNGKPSKAIMNFHNIQTQDLNKEFETKLLDCIKCESCGHSWIPGTETSSTREQALAWWGNLPFNSSNNVSKTSYCKKYYGNFTLARTYDTLTDKEIEEIYDKEVLEPKRQEEWQESQVNRRYSKPNQKQFSLEPEKQQVVDFEPKKNQKQFKQFSLELFKSYINKFSDEDKLKALFHIAQSLDMNVYQQQYKFELYPKLK